MLGNGGLIMPGKLNFRGKIKKKVTKKLLKYLHNSNDCVTFVGVKIEIIEVMKTSELTAALLNAGCYILRNGSRHDIWFSPITNCKFPVPRHGAKEIPNGTEKSIKKQAGI